MNKSCAFNLALAFGFAAVAPLMAAQPSQSERADHARQTVAVTGCLQRNAPNQNAPGTTTTTPSPTATTGAAVGTTGEDQFVLIKAAAGPGGTGTWQSAKPNGPWYFVVGDNAKLRHDENHLIEVIGTLDTAGSVVGTSASSTDGPSGTIHARTIKVVNASCNR
jgi:hypothetical protein